MSTTQTQTRNSNPDDALPSHEQLSAANAAYVFDSQGNRVDFSSLLDQAKTNKIPLLLVFTRHFHCGMCKEFNKALSESRILTDASRVSVIIVGPGQAAGLEHYQQQVDNPPFQFYADPDLRLYHALGVTRRNLDLGDASKDKIGSHHKEGVTQTFLSSVAEIVKSGSLALKGGDFKQLGGEFVWNKEDIDMSSNNATASNPGIAGSNLLPGKIVAITGASRGIGRACALACAAHGAKGVIVHYFGDAVTKAEAETLQDELAKLGAKGILVPGDIANAEVGQSIADAAEKEFGRLDVFVSNAGICPFMGFLEMEVDTWRKVQEVNLNGAFFATQAAARLMARQTPRGGSLIAIASISALVGGEFQSHYTPTKAGLKSMMESAAIGLGPLGIRCNSVLPGTIATAINEDDLKDTAKREKMIARHPLRRLGTPEDIAGPVVFLASDLAQFMTGSSMLVDGGCFVNLQ
ncbi:related to Glucose 1-dehydrogenase / peroxisomal 2,4-dienoyl-CoA reductase [Ustilago trichophora]|uniref:Related to Glucose 1-dehydrogenase / peroxisomal 2,4-dienoyl-CoA reductase n=1 Tax=Ustilago trichophora TaxID=86804 RepID=A0A5C3E2Z1_9BASI|nr:related to Glucose 1-dehydrogenase / peroxisomal 2,4-dienoyl-CoA reductase [Ustilago trichophora]